MGYPFLFYLSSGKDLPVEKIRKTSESDHSLCQQILEIQEIQEILQEILY